MITTSSTKLRLVFSTQSGRTFTITLPSPQDDMTAAEAEAVMDLITSHNIFKTAGGDLTGKRDIKVIDTSTKDFYNPPAV